VNRADEAGGTQGWQEFKPAECGIAPVFSISKNHDAYAAKASVLCAILVDRFIDGDLQLGAADGSDEVTPIVVDLKFDEHYLLL
jgi:hypothetical protein